jgi:hypothetical protein
MIGKMDPRDRVCLSIRAKDECVQQDFYARLGADFVERALDAFGIENDKDAAMPHGRRDRTPVPELNEDLVCDPGDRLPGRVNERVETAIGENAAHRRGAAETSPRLDQSNAGASAHRPHGGSDTRRASAHDEDIIFLGPHGSSSSSLGCLGLCGL